jgi:hypothetical protein
MAITDILSALDAEIKRLKQVRILLTTSPHTATAAKPATKKRKRKMSAAARKRIGDAQRKRWAKQKKRSD